MPSDERLATPPAGSKRGLLAARTSRVPAGDLRLRGRGNSLERALELQRIECAILGRGVAHAFDVDYAQRAVAIHGHARWKPARRQRARQLSTPALPDEQRRWRCCRRTRRKSSAHRARMSRPPAGCRAYLPAKSRSSTPCARRVPVSTSEIESEWPFATATSFSSGLSARADGARPTATSRVGKIFSIDHRKRAGDRRAGLRICRHHRAARRSHRVRFHRPAPTAIGDEDMRARRHDAERRHPHRNLAFHLFRFGIDDGQRVVAAKSYVSRFPVG